MANNQKPLSARVDGRNIRTEYSDGKGRIFRVTHAKYPNEAIKNAVGHLQEDHYVGSTVAEIFDTDTYELHAQVAKRLHNNKIEIVYERDPMNYVIKGQLESFRKFMAKGGHKV